MRRGDSVNICGRRGDVLKAAKVELPSIETCIADITDPNDQDRLFDLAEKCGPVTALFNNAGITRMISDFSQNGSSDADIADLFSINCIAPFQLARRMVARGAKGGRIVQIGSIASIAPLHNQSVYCGTKAALRHGSESVRVHVEAAGFNLSHVMTPAVDTDMTAQMGGPKISAEILARRIAKGVDRRQKTIRPHFDCYTSEAGYRFALWFLRWFANWMYR